jgi:hypothetical protein
MLKEIIERKQNAKELEFETFVYVMVNSKQ